MRRWLLDWWKGEDGTVCATAWVFVASILVLGMALRLDCFRQKMRGEVEPGWRATVRPGETTAR